MALRQSLLPHPSFGHTEDSIGSSRSQRLVRLTMGSFANQMIPSLSKLPHQYRDLS